MKRERGTDILLLWRGCYSRGVCGDGCACHNKMNRDDGFVEEIKRESGDGSSI
jgi:hypothetical protein